MTGLEWIEYAIGFDPSARFDDNDPFDVRHALVNVSAEECRDILTAIPEQCKIMISRSGEVYTVAVEIIS